VIDLLSISENQLHDPMGALLLLKERVYDHERFTMDEYLEHLAQSVWKFHGKGLDVQGCTIEEKCESAIQQLISHGLIHVH
jgi:hypothetical protein